MAFDITSPSTWDFNGVIDSMTSLVTLNNSVQTMQGNQKLNAAALDLKLAQARAEVAKVQGYGPVPVGTQLPPLTATPANNTQANNTTTDKPTAGLSTPLMLGGAAVLLVGGYLMFGRKK